MKKYQYKLYIDQTETPVAFTIRERPKKKVDRHHMTDVPPEFSVLMLEG